MNKAELVRATAEKTGLPQTTVSKALEGFVEVATETLADGENVAVKGFGTFKVTEVAARDYDTPAFKGTVPAHRKVGFAPSAALKELVR